MTACPATAPNSTTNTQRRFFQWPKDSERGAFDVVPCAFIFLNTGLSLSCRRTHSDTASMAREARNGTRQPHDANWASPITSLTLRTTINERMNPSDAVI